MPIPTSLTCPHCRFESPAGMKFCGRCGRPLADPCPGCGTPVPPGFRFCGECGRPVEPGLGPAAAAPTSPPSVPAPVAPSAVPFAAPERKQVTLLHCTLADARDLEERLDPEALHAVLDRFLERVRRQVERYGGRLDRRLEHGCVALFGAPVAHEDHALRAVLAALEIARGTRVDRPGERVPAVAGELDELRVRAGLDSGLAVVGGAGGLTVGETSRRARQLHDRAEPGEILLSAATARSVRGPVVVEAVQPPREAGDELDEGPGSVYRAVEVRHGAPGRAVDSDFEGGSVSPFVGRRRELAVLEDLRDEADRGRGQVVGLAGEAGAGKSRLLYELRRRSDEAPAVHLRGHCASYGSGVPYFPLVGMLRNAARLRPSDPPAVVAERLRHTLEVIHPDLSDTLPALLHVLGAGDDPQLEALPPQALQGRVFEALRRVILEGSRHALVVVEIEDLHWIDRTSEEFLAWLVESLAAARVLLLLTYRAGYRPRWMDKSYATQIRVRPLTRDDCRAVAESILGSGPAADGETVQGEALRGETVRGETVQGEPRGAVDELLAKAEGNPFFVEELARSLRDRSLREPSPGGGGAPGGGVPDTVQDLVASRIDRLPEEHKRLLTAASVLGREISLDLLARMWGGSREALEPLLRDLRAWELLHQVPGEEDALVFKHTLTQEVAYGSLVQARRQELHRAAARALESMFDGHLEDVYDQLAFHWPRADDPARTVHYLALFAGKAAHENAHAEAVRAYREALAHAERLADVARPEAGAPESAGSEAVGAGAGQDRRILELALAAASSLLPLARFAETGELLDRHAFRLERVDDLRLAGRFHFWRAHTHGWLGEPAEAARSAAAGLEAARRAGDEGTEGRLLYVLARQGFWGGDPEPPVALEHGQRAVVLLERSGDLWWQAQAYWALGLLHAQAADWDRALEVLERCRGIGEALDDPRLDPSWTMGWIHACRGDSDRAVDLCRRALARARDPLDRATAQGFLGHALLTAGNPDEALPLLQESVARVADSAVRPLHAWLTLLLAQALTTTGHPQEARPLLSQALETAQASHFPHALALAKTTPERP